MKKFKHQIFMQVFMLSIILVMSSYSTFAQNPFTDPSNSGGWILNQDLSDEFEEGTIDETKFLLQGRNGEYRSNWIGRAPSQFSPDNARQENGSLKLQTRWEPDFEFSTTPQRDGTKYENITVSAVVTRKQFLYGYMEIKSKSANISIQSSFWATGKGCELDIFENNGKPSLPNKEKLETELWSSIHDWSQGGGPTIWTGKKQMPFRFADDFHVYGCEWDPEYIKIFVDGQLMRHVTKDEMGDNWIMDQPIWLWLDNETFPWQGNPSQADLPADYEVQYLRVWQKELSTPGPVTRVKVSNPTLKMQKGQKGFLTKEVFPFNATNQSVRWTSSNTSVAKVSGGGVVTALKKGTATITVKSIDGNKTDACIVTITDPITDNIVSDSGFESGNLNDWEDSKGNASVVSNNAHSGSKSVYFDGAGTAAQIIRVDPNTVYTLSAWAKTGGADQQIYIGANEHDGKNVALKFNNPSYNEKSGYFTTGPNSYSSRVYAWNGNKNWKINADDIKVFGSVSSTNAIPVSNVTLSRNTLTLRQRESEMVIPKVLPFNATDKSYTWTSSNTRVCTVTPIGAVLGKQVGTAIITIRTADGNKTASCVVTVNPLNSTQVSVTGVTVSPTSTSIAEGATTMLNVNVLPSNATNKTVTWSSNNTSVATVNSSGVVTAQSQGVAVITVRTSDGNKTAIFNITVTEETATSGIPLGSTIWLKSYGDKYVARASGNNLQATENNLNSGGQFEVVDAGNEFVALKNIENNKYVQVINNSGNSLRAGSSGIFNRQLYTWTSQGTNKVALKAKINNKFVWVDNSKSTKPVQAHSNSIGDWETFTWGIVNSGRRSTAKSNVIKDTSQIEEVRIYPNPFEKGNLNIELAEVSDVSVTVFDITGKAIFIKKYVEQSNITINTEQVRLTSGVYYIKIQNAVKKAIMKKLIVQ
ncbi:hypothetical protein A8C32_00500 [Flavivirga aquatica]|uniref:GH16 domain-containing protein n=1 Tax=Flavivirga aquatica TaxID=1849968 RepID=A0A1E5TBP7_9FLAO|nr:Ig-like domain-containing protein [Flavivirga aquatica]OEK08792.1 hypothetical protein A8C32_00500 [Flavivirga aquatica]